MNVFWFRRDLRLHDNAGLYHALDSGSDVLPIFIFDDDILSELPEDDARVNFIYDRLKLIDNDLKSKGSSLMVTKGKPLNVWKSLFEEYDIKNVFTNGDYEPYALKRDKEVADLLSNHSSKLKTFKDQVIFEKSEVVKADGRPYTVYTPYKNKWLEHFDRKMLSAYPSEESNNFYQINLPFPERSSLGITQSAVRVKDFDIKDVSTYDETRNFPALNATSYLSPHLRFGTVSTREIISRTIDVNDTFVSELIWREFFMQILYHFPHVITQSFRPKYDNITWRNDEREFKLWCEGKTGYPMVDAGMRELNNTGYMHNRVRMVVASFLCKHLLIDWRWGEAYFAKKLLDYDLSANNGNWQWAAGTGCDAAPYFRVFNPSEQVKKFDKELKYINQWIPEYNSLEYPQPIVEHKAARLRALEIYKAGIESYQ